MSDYSPVSCEAHSLYELAVMQRKACSYAGRIVTE
jgi:hypothetical protein